MTAETETVTDLIVLPTNTDLTALYGGNGKPSQIDQTIARIRERVKSEVADVSSPKGRDTIRSLAASVSRSKRALERAALDLTEQWRKNTSAVNAETADAIDALLAKNPTRKNATAQLVEAMADGKIPHVHVEF